LNLVNMRTSDLKLQLTKGFFVDLGQIGRLLSFAVEHGNEARVAPQGFQDAVGLSGSKFRGLSSLAAAFSLLRPVVFRPTALGLLVHQYDPYLSDSGTLWLLHDLLSSEERYVVWNRVVNRVVPENERFSTVIARPYFTDLATVFSEHSMEKHLRKELGVVWDAYTQQAFRHLDYIHAESDTIYVRGNGAPVSPRIFHAVVLTYRDRFAPEAILLDVPLLAAGPNSPGRVFNLTERAVRDLLLEIERLGYGYVETRAGLDQIRFRQGHAFLDVVREYYEERSK
jgi:hypothetical protein